MAHIYHKTIRTETVKKNKTKSSECVVGEITKHPNSRKMHCFVFLFHYLFFLHILMINSRKKLDILVKERFKWK